MPLKIQNYGEWKGDKPGGHHPPACTCYRCNEERRQVEASKEEERRVKEYDRRTAETQARSGGGKQQSSPNRSPSQDRAPAPSQPQPWHSNQGSRNRASQSSQSPRTSSHRRASAAVRQSEAGPRPATPPRKPQRRQSRVFGMSRVITASALRYAIALHAVAVVGLVVYALVQGGAPSMMPTLDGASEAYVHAWRTAGALVGLG